MPRVAELNLARISGWHRGHLVVTGVVVPRRGPGARLSGAS
jgi:hypothetical protein